MTKKVLVALAGRISEKTRKEFDEAMVIHAEKSGGRIFHQEALEFAAQLYVKYWSKKK